MALKRVWKLTPGSAKTAIWPTPPRTGAVWTPEEAEMREILAIPCVEEVSREGQLASKIVIAADSLEQLVRILPEVRSQILAIIVRHHTTTLT